MTLLGENNKIFHGAVNGECQKHFQQFHLLLFEYCIRIEDGMILFRKKGQEDWIFTWVIESFL